MAIETAAIKTGRVTGERSTTIRRWMGLLAAAAWLLLTAAQASLAKEPAPVAASQATSAPAVKAAPTEDIWELLYLQSAKVGYSHTTVRPVKRDGKDLVEVDSEQKLSIVRFGEKSEQTIHLTSLETPAGALLEFKTELNFGPKPMIVIGRVEGDKLLLETQTQGKVSKSKLPWSADVLGFRGVEQSLEAKPLKPGEKRRLKTLMPIVNQVVDIELEARDLETTDVLGVQTKLMRVESSANVPLAGAMNSTSWLDSRGQTIKTHVAALNQETFRTTKALAMAEDKGKVGFDLGSDLIVKLDKPLVKPHQSSQATYRVEMESEDPAKVFARGDTQTIRVVGPHAVDLTVTRIRPGDKPDKPAAVAPIDKQYLSANSMLQVDDPRIQAMAREGRGDAKTPVDVALALERYVHRVMSKKNFSQAFATAAEVAESREGDCTEHAVLLAALLRASDIPSRVAIGLVYVPTDQGFGYHMWTEAYLDGRWVPLDATLGQGGIGAGHIKLTATSLDGASAYSAFLPVVQVVGQLKLSVVSSE